MIDESNDEGIDRVIGEEKWQVTLVGALTRTLQDQFHEVNTINKTDAFYHKGYNAALQVNQTSFTQDAKSVKYIFPYFSVLNLKLNRRHIC